MEEELIGQLRDVSGDAVVTCELCGLPHAAATIVTIAGRRSVSEPVEQLRACTACRLLMEAGELPADIESDAEQLLPEEL